MEVLYIILISSLVQNSFDADFYLFLVRHSDMQALILVRQKKEIHTGLEQIEGE